VSPETGIPTCVGNTLQVFLQRAGCWSIPTCVGSKLRGPDRTIPTCVGLVCMKLAALPCSAQPSVAVFPNFDDAAVSPASSTSQSRTHGRWFPRAV